MINTQARHKVNRSYARNHEEHLSVQVSPKHNTMTLPKLYLF